jgi:hypothetical protein
MLSKEASQGHKMASPLLAEDVWPSLILEMRLLGPIPIVIGLITEWVVLRFAFDLSWKKAAWVDVVMNAASILVGAVVIPKAGLLVTFGGLFELSLLLWYFVAVLMSTAIQASVVKWLFKVPTYYRQLWILCGANGMSAGIALIGVIADLRIARQFPRGY